MFEILNTTVILPLQLLAQIDPPDIHMTIDLDNPDTSLAALEFGVISLGFGSRREVHVFNKSAITQEFKIKIEP